MPQQILYRDEIVIVVPDVRVVLVQYAEGTEDGGVQEHLPFFLQPHDTNGREEFGYGGQAHAGAGGHGGVRIGFSVAAGIEERVIAHHRHDGPFDGPVVHKTVHHLVHGREAGELVGKGRIQVFHPAYGNGRLLFLPGRRLFLAPNAQAEARPQQNGQRKCPVYDTAKIHGLMRPAFRPNSMM